MTILCYVQPIILLFIVKHHPTTLTQVTKRSMCIAISKSVTSSDVINIKMMRNGGFAAKLIPKK